MKQCFNLKASQCISYTGVGEAFARAAKYGPEANLDLLNQNEVNTPSVDNGFNFPNGMN